MLRTRRHILREFLRRLLATGCAALILLLGLMAASPTLHAWVHHHAETAGPEDAPNSKHPAPAEAEHGCVVVWFAHGVSLALDTAVLAALPATWHQRCAPVTDELLLTTPRYWLQPERGPPVC
ncbi:MAG: hypothetical protein ACHQ4G_00135 [Opitutales bacterium]